MTTERAKPDYWVVKIGCMYIRPNIPGEASMFTRKLREATMFGDLDSAQSRASVVRGRVIAVRRKPSVKRRIAELVARCKAAIDDVRKKNNGERGFAAPIDTAGKTCVLFACEVAATLQFIDPAAAAEIRAYWEAK